jgi:hypothetical protein
MSPATSVRVFRLIALAALTGAAGVSTTAAQQSGLQSYDVELVIFQHLGASDSAENWGLEAGAAGERMSIPDEEPSPFGAQSAAPPAAASFPALPASKHKLTAVEETLRRSRKYRPLAHIGWTQPGFPRTEAKYSPLSAMVGPSTGVVGQVALSRGRYLHLTLDLVFTPPEEGGQGYVLRQTRRMRSNERHYFDHPKFGVIALITPAASD